MHNLQEENVSHTPDLNDFSDSAYARDDVAVPDDATMIEGVDDYFVFHVRPRPDAAALSPETAADDGARSAAC